MHERSLALVRQLRDRELHETVELLVRLTDLRKGSDPKSHLDLAIGYEAISYEGRGLLEDACATADAGLSHRKQQMLPSARSTSEQPTNEGEVSWPEAYYVRGRISFALGRYSAAEDDLSVALRQFGAPPPSERIRARLAHKTRLARMHYWHGRAVQELIRRDLLRAAEFDFREYVRLGAPLGDVTRVQDFLAQRATTRAAGRSPSSP
jgi:hypothetical protein